MPLAVIGALDGAGVSLYRWLHRYGNGPRTRERESAALMCCFSSDRGSGRLTLSLRRAGIKVGSLYETSARVARLGWEKMAIRLTF